MTESSAAAPEGSSAESKADWILTGSSRFAAPLSAAADHRVLELKPQERIVAIKNVTINEPVSWDNFRDCPSCRAC